jgi:hypothetical protein
MEFHKAIEEFQLISRELEKAQRRKTIRSILKLILIGFFIGKGIEKQVSELAAKKDKMKESINEQVNLELSSVGHRVKEIQNSGTYLVHADKEQFLSSLELFDADLTLLGENNIFEQDYIMKMNLFSHSRHHILG